MATMRAGKETGKQLNELSGEVKFDDDGVPRRPVGSKSTNTKPPATNTQADRLFWMFIQVGAVMCICLWAFYIRLSAVYGFGRVIHEFDPWFNFRATQYLVDNGWDKFVNWFDDQSWYPIGRPVGSTVYPGMMVTAAAIFKACGALGIDVSLNDVCVFIPAFFGTFASLFTGGICYEASRCINTSIIATLIMAIIPAHIMRSVAGGYDNESIAVTAICSTFYFWLVSLRGPRWWPVSVIAGLSYFYMVAAWGGYVFVLNMVGVHAGVLALLNFLNGTFSRTLYTSYSLFFVIGTIGALQVPIPYTPSTIPYTLY
jgi:dolichyl-diphosphooligosaccharide--protein glycosyltransferase